MSSEQKHNISFIPFFFFITYKILTCERHLYLPFTTYKSTTESATLRPLNSGYYRLHFVAASTNPWNSGCGLLGLDFSSGCACVAMNQG